MTPLPRWPPKMNPAFTVLGMIATASAFSKMERGMELSGASMISSNTAVAASSRSISSCCANAAAAPRCNTSPAINNRT